MKMLNHKVTSEGLTSSDIGN